MRILWWLCALQLVGDFYIQCAKIAGYKPKPFAEYTVGEKTTTLLLWIPCTVAIAYFFWMGKP